MNTQEIYDIKDIQGIINSYQYQLEHSEKMKDTLSAIKHLKMKESMLGACKNGRWIYYHQNTYILPSRFNFKWGPRDFLPQNERTFSIERY